ncbi:hypothetical protein [Listeria booriae]|uniref:hypothetical protein n=1 Tax=Listeria booriae TaxID=1552123 RepID=UPI001628133F|nr:hypothetical protein [Listeria booriae]MBC1502432.1 hypothetical protein [Listeria booriae]MBC2259642.1 hypothetical protein [Listeria booriae]
MQRRDLIKLIDEYRRLGKFDAEKNAFLLDCCEKRNERVMKSRHFTITFLTTLAFSIIGGTFAWFLFFYSSYMSESSLGLFLDIIGGATDSKAKIMEQDLEAMEKIISYVIAVYTVTVIVILVGTSRNGKIKEMEFELAKEKILASDK